MQRKTIAAHIPAYNCPDLLKKCLDHLTWVDEILIADNSTNDDIRNLVARLDLPKLKYVHCQERDIRTRLTDLRDEMESDYVLWVCTDEFYTREAGEEILRKLSSEETLRDGYVVTSKTYHYGKFDPYEWNHLRLFRRDKYYFDMLSIHEQPKVKGTIGLIENFYYHIQLEKIASQANKIFFYADNDARLKSIEELEKVRTDKFSSLKIKIHFYTQLMRMIWRTRIMLFRRNVSHADLFQRYEQILTVIANDSVPTEEIRKREGSEANYFQDIATITNEGSTKPQETGVHSVVSHISS